MATPTVTASGHSTVSGGGTDSITLPLTIPSGNENNLLIVESIDFGPYSPTLMSNIKYNGADFTDVIGFTAGVAFVYTKGYYKVAPTADGSSHNLVVTYSGTDQCDIIAVNVKDAAQTTPFEAITNGGSGSAATSGSLNVATSTANDMCFVFTYLSGNNAQTVTPGALQSSVESFRRSTATSTTWMDYESEPTTSADTYTLSVSWSISTGYEQHAYGVKYQAPSGGGSSVIRQLMSSGVGK